MPNRASDSNPDPQRLALVGCSTPEWPGKLACYDDELSSEERLELAAQLTPQWRGKIAFEVLALALAERFALAQRSTPKVASRARLLLPAPPRLAIGHASDFGLAAARSCSSLRSRMGPHADPFCAPYRQRYAREAWCRRSRRGR